MVDGGRTLVPGQNVQVPEGALCFRISTNLGADAYCCALRTDQKAASLADVVARGKPSGVEGRIAMLAATPTGVSFTVESQALPADVTRLVFCLATPETPAAAEGHIHASISLNCGGADIAVFDTDRPRAPVTFLGELYRRNMHWKFRALGQDFKTFSDFGNFVGLAEDQLRAAAVVPAPPPPRAPAPQPSIQPPPPPKLAANVGGLDARATPDRIAPAKKVALTTPPAPHPPASPPTTAFSLQGWMLTPDGIVASPASALGSQRAVEAELLDVRPDSAGRLWPAHFLFQPQTGEPLAGFPCSVLTNGRPISASGLPELSDVAGLDPDGLRQENRMPVGARVFAAGGNPPRLVALDPREGRAWWKAPVSGEWVALGRCPTSPDLPIYAIGAVGTGEGVFYASGHRLDCLLGSFGSEPASLELGGTVAAPPFALGETVVVPVISDRGLAVAVRDPGGALSIVRVKDAPANLAPLGSAVGELEAGRCFWVGSSGFLAFEDHQGERVAVFNAWPAGVEGLSFLTPYRARNGKLWALCVRVSGDGRSREGALACAMTWGGKRETRETKALPGPFISAGPQTFRNRERHGDPWAPAEEEINVGLDYAGRWLCPLARIGERHTLVGLVADVRGAATVRDFVFREAQPVTRDMALALHADHGGLRMLRQSFKISSTDDLDIYRDGDRLCVHHSESNTCASWPLDFHC